MPDDEKAEAWFRKSAEAGNDFSQYALGKLLHHLAQTFRQDTVSPKAPVGLEPVDRKPRAQIREKKIAMGHKPNDHEEQQQGWTMAMG